MAQKICLLLSGGLDSALLLARARDQRQSIHALYVSFGFSWEYAERHYLKQILEWCCSPENPPLILRPYPYRCFHPKHWGFSPWKVPDQRSPDQQVLIPGRNQVFFAEAFSHAEENGLNEVWLGTLKNNPFPDAQAQYLQALEKSLNRDRKKFIHFQTPLASRQKSEWIKKYPDFPYALTFSCLRPQGLFHCGHCNKCAERQRAFARAGIPDPTRYSSPLKVHVY